MLHTIIDYICYGIYIGAAFKFQSTVIREWTALRSDMKRRNELLEKLAGGR